MLVNDGKIPWSEVNKYIWKTNNSVSNFVLNPTPNTESFVYRYSSGAQGNYIPTTKFVPLSWIIVNIRPGYNLENKESKVQRKINYIYEKQRERGINV